MYGTVMLAAMNLILAAIVDSGAQAREDAMEARRKREELGKRKEKEKQKAALLDLCKRLDYDDSGSLTIGELLDGFDKNAEFREAMRSYQIERKDVEIIFNVIDESQTGEIDYMEFLSLVEKAREQASNQVLTFVKFALLDMRQSLISGQMNLRNELADLKKSVADLQEKTGPKMPQPTMNGTKPGQGVKKSNGVNGAVPMQNGNGAAHFRSVYGDAAASIRQSVVQSPEAARGTRKSTAGGSPLEKERRPSVTRQSDKSSGGSADSPRTGRKADSPRRTDSPRRETSSKPNTSLRDGGNGKIPAKEPPGVGENGNLEGPGDSKSISPEKYQELVSMNEELVLSLRKLLAFHGLHPHTASANQVRLDTEQPLIPETSIPRGPTSVIAQI